MSDCRSEVGSCPGFLRFSFSYKNGEAGLKSAGLDSYLLISIMWDRGPLTQRALV